MMPHSEPVRQGGATAKKGPRKRRILIVDDNEEIHNDFRRILSPPADTSALDDMEAFLFGTPRAGRLDASFEIASAHQGAEALSMVQEAHAAGAPYMLIFVDVRMPPGWDGIETLSRIWQEDMDVQSILCSAYLDYSWHDILARFPETDRLLILKKPFDPMEVRQMAYALTEKWNQSADAKEAALALRKSEAEHRELLDAVKAQAHALSVLSSPIIPIHKDVIVMPLIGEMDAARARHMHEKLVHGVAERRARVAILDVTGLPSLCAEVADELVRTARSVRLLGSEVVITGIHPEVAQTLVALNINLSGITTLQSLESGIAYAMKRR
jgi:anti-anti-sigma factor